MRTRPAAHPPPPPARSDSGEPRRRATAVWLSLALLMVTTAVYLPVRHYDFVNYDDPDFVRDNPTVHAGLTLDTFRWACTTFQVGNWHPLTTLSYVLDYQLFGLNPGAYHLENVGFHVLNTLLLFWVLARLTGQTWPSAWVAALFALHPLHVESVAWIAERKDVLSTCFWLLTLWAYYAYVRQPGGRRYAVLLAAYIAALLSKPMVVTLPFVLLLIDIWPLRRWGGGDERGSGGAGEQRQKLRSSAPLLLRSLASLVIEKIPLFLMAGSITVLSYMGEVRAGAVNSLQTRPLTGRLANVTLQYGAYLGQMLWPAGLAVYYPFEPALPVWEVLGAGTVLLVISAGVLWGARRYPYLLTGWLWYLGMLVPVIGFVPGGGLARGDRFTYLPLVGIFIMAAWGVPDLLRGWQYRRATCTVAAVAALAACTALTARQLTFWRDSVSLFEHALAVTHDNLLAHSLIGTLEMDDGRRDAALRNLSEAARICDTARGAKTICAQAHYNTGLLLAKRGDLDGAQQHYRAALRFDASYPQPHLALGQALAARGDLSGGAAAYREALRLDPTLAAAHNNLAIVLETMGQTDEALAHYREGVRLEPQNAASRCNLASALAAAGRFQEATEQYRIALQFKPQLVEARLALAATEAQRGHMREALAALEELLHDQPDSVAAETMLAWMLATAEDAQLRDGVQAVRLAEAAAQRTGQRDAGALNSLAAAYAEVGRFPDAVTVAEQAQALARANGHTELLTALDARLALYRAGHAVREPAGGGYREGGDNRQGDNRQQTGGG